MALKGLALAQADARRGTLDRERRAEIKEAVEGLIDNLSAHEEPPAVRDGASAEAAAVGPQGKNASEPPTTVLCVGGGGPLDEAAAAMLAQVLVKRGFGARVVPSHEASAGGILRLDVDGIESVVISYLDPGGLANARYLVRRLRRRLSASVPILLGLWTQSDAGTDRANAVDTTGANAIVTSLAEAVDVVANGGQERTSSAA